MPPWPGTSGMGCVTEQLTRSLPSQEDWTRPPGQGAFPGEQMSPEAREVEKGWWKRTLKKEKQGCQVAVWAAPKLSREPAMRSLACRPHSGLHTCSQRASAACDSAAATEEGMSEGCCDWDGEGWGQGEHRTWNTGTFSHELWGCALLHINSCDQPPRLRGPAGPGWL